MQLIITGCEYSGTTTLTKAICRWIEQAMGEEVSSHDHFKWPPIEEGKDFSTEEIEQLMALSPKLQETYQRYVIEYHLNPAFFAYPHFVVVGMHIDEAVYAPLYYGYGGKDEYADRAVEARKTEDRILELAPHSVQVLVKASPGVISKRMNESPHEHGLVPESDIEHVLQRFEEEHERSHIRNKIAIDTSTATVEQSLKEFVQKIEEFLTDADRLRILVQKARDKGEWI